MTTQHDLTPMRVDLTPFIRKSPKRRCWRFPKPSGDEVTMPARAEAVEVIRVPETMAADSGRV